MSKGFFEVPMVLNEPILSYAPDTPEREELQAKYKEMFNQVMDCPMWIDGKAVTTNNKMAITPPHDHQHVVGHAHRGDASHVKQAIDAALAAKEKWETMAWENRATIFLKAADLLAGPYRATINAATMINQSKNAFQAEIDAACEQIDFFRFNVQFMTEMFEEQPVSDDGIWNRSEYRPLEGFVYAITPFNFTAIASNLPCAAALMGNTVVWKPSDSQLYSAQIIMQVLREAGLPDGVINMIHTDPVETSDIVLSHPDFAGLHFTGSTTVFQNLWKQIGENIHKYKTYPRIVGETGGKDFIVAHKTALPKAVSTAMVRGAFEFQGQKCSAASRAYIPSNMWDEVKGYVLEDLKSMKMGSPEDFSNFITAVIHEGSFDKIAKYIDDAKNDPNAEIIAGGNYDKSKGYFVEPTVILVKDPKYVTMCEEIFGPVLTVYVYDENKWEETLDLVDETSVYALTGAILAQDRYAVEYATKRLRNSAGNFYINDKPTGAVVGQQPFGGARASGTNDKAGSKLNLLRWTSVRSIKETMVPPTDYRYPFLGE